MRGNFESGLPLRIKIEMNSYERSPARPHQLKEFEVASTWFRGGASVLTFDPHELVSTKIRALYQRSKGRDLFDLWLALNQLHLNGREIAKCFGPYRPIGYTRLLGEANLAAKLHNVTFRQDLTPLVSSWPDAYELEAAAEQVRTEVIAHL